MFEIFCKIRNFMFTKGAGRENNHYIRFYFFNNEVVRKICIENKDEETEWKENDKIYRSIYTYHWTNKSMQTLSALERHHMGVHQNLRYNSHINSAFFYSVVSSEHNYTVRLRNRTWRGHITRYFVKLVMNTILIDATWKSRLLRRCYQVLISAPRK